MKKPSKRELFLLKILGATIAGGGLLLLLAATLPSLGETQADIALKENNIRNIQSLRVNEAGLGRNFERLTQSIAAEKSRYYAPEDRDLTKLGIRMLSLIDKHGLRYSRLNKVDAKDGSHLEIALNGRIVNIMRLVGDIYNSPKYLNVISLSLSHKGGQALATIRMNYGENAALSP